MSGHPFDGVVKAWREDPAYRARVEEDPKAALAEKGVDMSGVDEVRVASTRRKPSMWFSRTGARRCPTARWSAWSVGRPVCGIPIPDTSSVTPGR